MFSFIIKSFMNQLLALLRNLNSLWSKQCVLWNTAFGLMVQMSHALICLLSLSTLLSTLPFASHYPPSKAWIKVFHYQSRFRFLAGSEYTAALYYNLSVWKFHQKTSSFSRRQFFKDYSTSARNSNIFFFTVSLLPYPDLSLSPSLVVG